MLFPPLILDPLPLFGPYLRSVNGVSMEVSRWMAPERALMPCCR